MALKPCKFCLQHNWVCNVNNRRMIAKCQVCGNELYFAFVREFSQKNSFHEHTAVKRASLLRRQPRIQISPAEILKEYQQLGTLDAVGQKIGLTRERVRQILNKHDRIAYHTHLDKKHEETLKKRIKKCLQCGTEFYVENNTVRFCSQKCAGANMTKNKILQLESTGVKLCIGCKETKPLDQFTRLKRANHLFLPRCRACWTKRTREWQHAHPEKYRESLHKAQQKIYRKKHPIVKRYWSADMKTWVFVKNPEPVEKSLVE